jgi:hypothetical protein
MEDYTIDVGRIEELQMINDIQELDNIFQKSKSALVNGATVHLARKNKMGKLIPFEHFTTLPDLSTYKKTVYKYLKRND